VNQFETLGSGSDKPKKGVPLATTQIFTGYWPNASPYRDAAVAYLYAKFYGATRNDKIAAGSNTEVSPRMTLCRRPGCPVWSSASFTDVTGFYSFNPFETGAGEQVYVIVDEATATYVATTSTKTLLYTKSAGAGKTRFKGEGNTLYMGNGVQTLKWSWFPAWAASTSYQPDQSILDSNNNIQLSLGYGVRITSTSVSSDIATINYTGTGVINQGDTVSLYGLTVASGLNDTTQIVLGAGSGFFTVSYSTSNYSTTADTGAAVDATQGNGTSGSSTPSFSGTIDSLVVDGTNVWVSQGNSVQNLGIVAPTTSPTVQNTLIPAPSSWAASTYYWPNPYIVDSNTSTGPWIWQLTTSGTTNSSVPSGLTSGTPIPQYSGGSQSASPTTVTDGTAVWTCNSLAARQTSTKYSAGQVILVSYTFVYYTYQFVQNDGGGGQLIKTAHNVTYMGFFQSKNSGTTSSSANSSLSWTSGLNTTVSDGSVTWVNVGLEVTRTASSTSSPTQGVDSNMVAGNVGDSLLVSTSNQISDSNGNGETVTIAGKSQTTAPTWSTTLGASVDDGTAPCLVWKNTGPLGAANTGVWFYAYSWVNLATGDESTASSLSSPILEAAGSGILVSGSGSPDTQVGQINIYRTTQQPVGSTSGTPFLLTSIPAPANGASWSYLDTTPDPPNSGATLNVEIIAAGYGIVDGVVSNYNDPPPTGLTNLEFYAGRMWGSVGNVIYYSTGPDVTVGNGNTSWNALNFYETPGVVYRLWPTTVGMFVFTDDGLWIIQGLGTSTSPFQEIQPADPSISILSYDAFSQSGTQGIIYTSDSKFYSVDPQNGTSWLGQPVGNDLVAGYTPSSVYVTYHSHGLDQIGLVTNGSNQWLSYMQVPAPETGYLWNPPATISAGSGGVGAVASIETAPGIHTLLIGPSNSGPILMRDSSYTTFADNETAYEAWAAFGNIVFAHHGQLAGLMHIGADFVRVGSQPQVSVLLDEILNQPNTPAWVSVPNPISDPTNLPQSDTLYQLRYWLIETQKPLYCRNALIKFDFGETDTVQNELLVFTVFGESLVETQ
jgi:hypothetical protein